MSQQVPNAAANAPQADQALTNHFQVQIDSNAMILKYTIALGNVGATLAPGAQPRQLSRETKRYLMNQLLTNQAHNPVAHTDWASDYDSIVISARPLYHDCDPTNPTATKRYFRTGLHGANGGPPTMIVENASVTCSPGPLNIAALNAYLNINVQDSWIPDRIANYMEAFNIISWKQIYDPNFAGGIAGKRFYPVTGNCENENQVRDDRKFLIRRGFTSSMRPGFGSVYLNVQTCTSAFYSPIMLSRWMQLMWPGRQPGLNEFQKQLKNVRVRIHSLEPGGRTWRIFGIELRDVSAHTFTDDQNVTQNVHTYLTRVYRVPIPPTDYCINVGNATHQIWYAASQLKICDWQILSKILDDSTYRERMLRFGRNTPQQNKTLILAATQDQNQLGFGQPFYTTFGLRPYNQFTSIQALQLRQPDALYGNGRTQIITNASWDLQGVQRLHRAAMRQTHVGVIAINNTTLNRNRGTQLLQDLRRYGVITGNGNVARFFGISLPVTDHNNVPANAITANEPGTDGFRAACISQLNMALTSIRNGSVGNRLLPVEILLVVIPPGQDYYAEVKRWGDCVAGIPTVCILSSKWDSLSRPAFRANICIKFNPKLGGENHQLVLQQGETAGNGLGGSPNHTMILGADVTHPGTRSEPSCPSLAALVATDGHGSSNYLASARVQESRQEIIQDLRSMVQERILAWVNKAANNSGLQPVDFLPKMLIFYRDGVGESQYTKVRSVEIPQIRGGYTSALEHLRANNAPLYTRIMGNTPPSAHTFGLVVIIAAKRHNTRFYPVETSPPNTDRNLTAGKAFRGSFMAPSFTNFHIQSHGSALGTARSSYYIVIENSNPQGNPLNDGQLSNITNNLCFTSSRCLKGISIATPARYADLVCDRLRCYMRPALFRNYRFPFTLPVATGQNQTVTPTDYANSTRLWRNNRATGPGQNPWLPALNNVMFYI